MVDSHRRSIAPLALTLAVLCAGGIALAFPGTLGAGTSLTRSTESFAVTFRDSGLTGGLTWQVNISHVNGSPALLIATANPSVVVRLATGSYLYTATGPTGWSFARKGLVPFSVHSTRTLTVPFVVAPGFGTFIFQERGLTRGTNWSVTLNWTGTSTTGTPPAMNATAFATAATIRFAAWIGALYHYQVSNVTGYIGPSMETGDLVGATHPQGDFSGTVPGRIIFWAT